MRFSESFKVNRTDEDDWFDTHLTIDTPLFIDPLLMFDVGGYWKKAHDELIAHFVHCYSLVAKSTGNNSISGKSVHKLLSFPEPFEFGFGYTKDGTKGAGSGKKYAGHMVHSIESAIRAGLTKIEHIEEIAILNEGIGADRISDATANVLKKQFILYTQNIARRHNIPLDKHRVRNSRVILEDARWCNEVVELPTNPETGAPIILVPEFILSELPILNAEDWFWSDLNEELRLSLDIKVKQKIPKKEIVEYARRNPHLVQEWVRSQACRSDLAPYNYDADPAGLVQWDKRPAQFAHDNPLPGRSVQTLEDFIGLIDEIIKKFDQFIKKQGGWSLLWNDDDSEKGEKAAQLAFLGFAQQYFRQFNIELDREVDFGRGPVDFKVSSGTSLRLLIEMKKLHNGKFWNGLRHQIVSYLESDGARVAWFIVLQYRDNAQASDRLKRLPLEAYKISQENNVRIFHKVIDVRRPLSASKITDISK